MNCLSLEHKSQRALRNVPLSEGQKSQNHVVASLRGSSVEECAEPFVDWHPLMETLLSFSHWCFTHENLMPHRSHDEFSKRVH